MQKKNKKINLNLKGKALYSREGITHNINRRMTRWEEIF